MDLFTAAAPLPVIPKALFDVRHVYYEPASLHTDTAEHIRARFPGARWEAVKSHWAIESFRTDESLVKDWNQIKRTTLVLGEKKAVTLRPNERSSDFIAGAMSNGCAMACSYCYVARRKGFANPITLFTNYGKVLDKIAAHARTLPAKTPNLVDPTHYVYEIGENGDLSVEALLHPALEEAVACFRHIPGAKSTFATKYVNRDLLTYDPRGKTRIRFSLMPAHIARVVDVRTSPMEERIAAINDFVAAGYEVHLNFSPVILYEGWLQDWRALFAELADRLSPQAKAQLACEIIMLRHEQALHELNLQWHPQGEALLWRPEWQEEAATTEAGIRKIRYRSGFKGQQVSLLKAELAKALPECLVRYAF